MSECTLEMTASPETYRQRRARLAAKLRRPLIVCAGSAPGRSYASNPYPFRAGCTYLYLGGPPLERASWVIEPGSDGDAGCTLLRVPPGPDDALWLGPTLSDTDIADAAGVDRARIRDSADLETVLARRMGAVIGAPHPPAPAMLCELGLEAADADEIRAIVNLRLIKDEAELAAMRRAADAAMDAHRSALAAVAPGRTESDVEAALMAGLTRHRCRPSFTPICTIRGEVLHGECKGRPLTDGDLLLLDAGAEEPTGYTSDMTRTVPVSGKWTEVQRHLYDTVLRAQRAAIDACRVGRRYRDIHHLAARTICAGLVEADLLRGDADDLIGRGAYALFFPHGVGHLLGLGVHDMEEFGDLAGYAPGRERSKRFGDNFLRLDRDLEAGMVVTIEPGIYLVPALWQREDLVAPFADAVNRPAVERLLASNFGGIRIEEDVLVRPEPDGPEVLTAAMPNDTDAVANLVGTS